MRLRTLIIPLLLFCACNNAEEQPVQSNPVVEEGFDKEHDAGGYTAYTGTVAGQPVVLHFIEFGPYILGKYYYEKVGRPIGLNNWYDTNRTDNTLYLTENSETERSDESAHWSVTISGDSMTGTWMSADGSKTYPIALKRDVSDDIQQFSVVYMDDSARYREDWPEPYAKSTYQLLLPSGHDTQTSYIRSVLYKITGCDTNSNTNIRDCIDQLNSDYYTDYRDLLKGMDSNDLVAAPSHFNRLTNNIIYYNKDGMVVLNDFYSEYTGGAHGNYGSTFLCIDCKEQKVLQLSDVMNIDTARLVVLLERKARDMFGMNNAEPLTSQMLAEELYVPSNFYITNKGVVFVYGTYEIASYADGEINLFIPYEQLMDLLTPAFKKRMKLIPAAS